jgi:hypothetical protein
MLKDDREGGVGEPVDGKTAGRIKRRPSFSVGKSGFTVFGFLVLPPPSSKKVMSWLVA